MRAAHLWLAAAATLTIGGGGVAWGQYVGGVVAVGWGIACAALAFLAADDGTKK